MARKRYISTEISTSGKLADLSSYGLLPLLLFTWSIPHMDDWGRITGDGRQFKLLVCPGLDVTVREVDETLNIIAAAGLWERYEVDGKRCIAVDPNKWFKHQSYINKGKREDDSGSDYPSPDKRRKTPQITEEHQEWPQLAEIQQGTAQIAASFSSSFSSSLSVSPYKTSTTTTTTTNVNPFQLFESEGFGTLSSVIGEKIGLMIDDYGDRWVCEAMKEAAYYSKRSLPYVKSILERYKVSGVDEPWTLEKQTEAPKVADMAQQTFRPQWRKGGAPAKPNIPVMPESKGKQLTPEEIEEIRRVARKLDGKAEVG